MQCYALKKKRFFFKILSMITLIGLGNPGEKYINTRHNIGRDALVYFMKKEKLEKLQKNKKTNSLRQKGEIKKSKIEIIIPETFMNNSGKTIKTLKLKPKNILLLHDDSDILFGKMKLSYGKNSGGHKGVESVKRALKTKDFWRLRIGVQKKKRIMAEKLVLIKFTKKELLELSKIKKKIERAINTFLSDGPEQAMNELNK